MVRKHKEYYALGISMLIIALVTGISLYERGIGGDIWDLTYHLLRIESVKEALLNGSYPARVNPIFFDGYGYGSSMFYPDLFLVIPAVMNICGISLLLSYKIFVLLLAMIGTCTTFFSLKFICGEWKCALTGSYVLMLSTYYLADVSNRAGLSEYIACVFVPVLVAGIYDYFACEGKRTWLLGIGFVGMVLCHTIMTYIGLLITAIIFMVMLFVPQKRKLVFERKRFVRLLVTAVLSVLSVSYYIFPMLEQMGEGRFRFNEPWANIGEYTQTFESFFSPVGVFMYTAQFGVGIAVLFMLASRVMLGKIKNKWADSLVAVGLMLLIAMTDVIPWNRLEDTSLNMIQFTYRLYPYALYFVICGICIAYAEKQKDGVVNRFVLGFLVIVAVVCGVWQTKHCAGIGTRIPISEEYVYDNNHWVGKGEWVPEGISDEIYNGQGNGLVVTEDGVYMDFVTSGYNRHFFDVTEDTGMSYKVPLMYYKGYRAQALLEDGSVKEVEVAGNAEGLLQVKLSHKFTGEVRVWYAGTMTQKVSNVISGVVLWGILLAVSWRFCRKLKIKNVKGSKIVLDTVARA